jgi:hypothetical protein
MTAPLKKYTDFLLAIGISDVSHTQKTYLGHLVNVYNLLKAQSLDEEVCLGGLFHSIYGTEKFQGFKLPLEKRHELETLVGPRAERLAFWNCLMDRATLDAQLEQRDGPFTIVNRETAEAMTLSTVEYNDLCNVHLFDWLEQAPRSRFGWDYRRAAYRKMAERLQPTALVIYDQVFSQENSATA